MTLDLEPGNSSPEPSTTEFLSHALGLAVRDFVDVFGAGWQSLPNDGTDLDSDPSGVGNIVGPWYVAGEPFQMALRPHSDRVEIGVPVGRWIGSHGMYWEAHDRRDVYGAGPELLEAAPPIIVDISSGADQHSATADIVAV